MKLIKWLLATVLALTPSLGMAQLAYYTDRAVGVSQFNGFTGLVPIPYGQVRVCADGAIGSPCNPVAAVYDLNGVSLAVTGGNFGQLTTDIVGRFNFQVFAGNYVIQVAATGSNTPQLSYRITVTQNSTYASGNFLIFNDNGAGIKFHSSSVSSGITSFYSGGLYGSAVLNAVLNGNGQLWMTPSCCAGTPLDVLRIDRFTDASPLGNFINLRTTLGTSLFSVDINGALVAASTGSFQNSVTVGPFPALTGSGIRVANTFGIWSRNQANSADILMLRLSGGANTLQLAAGTVTINTTNGNIATGGSITAPTGVNIGANVSWTSGAGVPSGASCTTAQGGSLYSRTDGTTTTSLYVCDGTTGVWTAK